MKLEVFEAKTVEEAMEKALKELDCSEKELIYKTSEKKGGLFKGTVYSVKAVKLIDVQEYIKKYLTNLLTNMGLEVKFESKIRDNQINIKMYSDNNSILIGKNGQTLSAIQTLLKQSIYNQIEMYPYFLLDVENYKDKKNYYLESSAKKVAREVLKTKIEVKLDDMNSYERRIVHNALAEFKNISTTSEGEDPHRHIVISYKED